MNPVKKIIDIINFLRDFTPGYDNFSHMHINSIPIDDYPELIKANNEIFSLQIKEIFLIVDKVKQQEIINNIKYNLDTLTGANFDKSQYLYEEDNRLDQENGEAIISYFLYNPMENYLVCKCYDIYVETIQELKDSFYWLLTQGGYIIEKEKLIGPLTSNVITLKRIKTKFNIYEFSYFLKLLIDARIIDCDEPSDVAEMISKYFINIKGEHFDKKSISNKITATGIQKQHKENVIIELKNILKKNT